MRLFVFALLALVVAPLHASTYTVTDIGSLGGSSTYPTAINNAGHVVGYGTTSTGDTRAFFWTQGSGMQNLGVIGSGSSKALDINNNDQIVGNTSDQAFRWTSSTNMTLIDSTHNGSANRINDGDVVIGTQVNSSINSAVQWSSTNAITVLLPGGSGFSFAGNAINNLGQSSGTTIQIGTDGWYINNHIGPQSTTFNVLPNDMNDAGLIVGSFGGFAAAYNVATKTTAHNFVNKFDLSSSVLGVNQPGLSVGFSVKSDSTSYGFLFDGIFANNPRTHDLNTLLDPQFANWSILSANDINDLGQIVGVGMLDGVQHAVILNPVPEPSSLVLAFFGFAGLAAWRWRRRTLV